MPDISTNTLIIGCGIAGAAAALRLSDDPNHDITIITRAASSADSNTGWAQGGIVTRGLDDTPELLVQDILHAGAGLSLPGAARLLADEGPRLVDDVLVQRCGVRFDRTEDDELVYGLEAAHSTRRIVHVGDKTGGAIIDGMLATLAARPNVCLLTSHTAVDLITFPHHALDPLAIYEPTVCYGAYVLERDSGEIVRVLAGQTILATGGLGQIFRNTTNPRGSRGDGLAMAWRAGVRVVNAEYVQFHPTALAVRGAPNWLISEAVRGEGAVLLTPGGEPFMRRYDPEWRDLAPRDVVARAIHMEMIEHGYDHVYLDLASKRPAEFIRERFPQFVDNCRAYGLDPTTEPIPVVPAAHYFCGGVLVDGWGRTDFDRLYAVGEVSCTGLHGANRLASTSLLEGLVWGDRAARDILTQQRDPIAIQRVPEWVYRGDGDPDPALIEGDMTTIRNIMWHYVGLVRTEDRLARADRELRHLFHEIESFYRSARLNDSLIGLRNAIQAARVITFMAYRNRTSRAHITAPTPLRHLNWLGRDGNAMTDFIYLDHSATTPTDPRVVAAMQPYWTQHFGNPSSLHSAGKAAADALERSTVTVAGVLNCAPSEIIFTSGGSESDNLALRGVAATMRGRGRGNHIITTAAEHHAVLDTVNALESEGFAVTVLPVDVEGRVSAEQVVAALREDTILVSVIYANNEVGSVNPIAEIGAALRGRRIPFHVDAVQAAGHLSLDVQALNVDLLSLSGHKFYGPKGIGLLYARRGIGLRALILGGTQQAHRRAGTEPIPLIVGIAEALRLAEVERAETVARLVPLRDHLISEVLRLIPEAALTGHATERLPGHTSFAMLGLNGDSILLDLNEVGIGASGGSACTTGQQEPSHVLSAMGVDPDRLMGQMRFVLGKHTTAAEVDRLLYHLTSLVQRHRAMVPTYR